LEDLELAFELEQIEKGDLELMLSGLFIVRSTLGSHIALRTLLERAGAFDVIHCTISAQKLYSAKWHELTPEKQHDITKPRQRKR